MYARLCVGVCERVRLCLKSLETMLLQYQQQRIFRIQRIAAKCREALIPTFVPDKAIVKLSVP